MMRKCFGKETLFVEAALQLRDNSAVHCSNRWIDYMINSNQNVTHLGTAWLLHVISPLEFNFANAKWILNINLVMG